MPKNGSLKHMFERNEIMLVEEVYSLYAEQVGEGLNMKVILGVCLLHYTGLFRLTEFLRDIREKVNTSTNMTTLFTVCYQNSQYA